MNLLRRTILAGSLLAAVLCPLVALAQSGPPPPVPALPDTARLTSYSITTSICACAVNFALYGDSTDYQDWVEVWLNGVEVSYNDPTYGWTITSPTGQLATIPRPITDAVLTFTNAQTGTVQIVGARRPRRLSQFNENQGVPARAFNQVLTDIISQNREIWDKTNDLTGRGLFFAPGNTTGPMPLPSQCASAFLSFDATGLNPKCQAGAPGSGNVVGPGTSTIGDLASFSNTTGNAIADSGVASLFKQPGIGAVTRTWNSKVADLINIKDFGAKCDGVTDDGAALQAAVNAAETAGTPIPVGSYGGSPGITWFGQCLTKRPIIATNLAAIPTAGIISPFLIIGGGEGSGLLWGGQDGNAQVDGSVSGTTLTVTSVLSGTIGVGQLLTDIGGNFAGGIYIVKQLTGTTGGIGTYQTSSSYIIGGDTITLTSAALVLGDPIGVTEGSGFDVENITCGMATTSNKPGDCIYMNFAVFNSLKNITLAGVHNGIYCFTNCILNHFEHIYAEEVFNDPIILAAANGNHVDNSEFYWCGEFCVNVQGGDSNVIGPSNDFEGTVGSSSSDVGGTVASINVVGSMTRITKNRHEDINAAAGSGMLPLILSGEGIVEDESMGWNATVGGPTFFVKITGVGSQFIFRNMQIGNPPIAGGPIIDAESTSVSTWEDGQNCDYTKIWGGTYASTQQLINACPNDNGPHTSIRGSINLTTTGATVGNTTAFVGFSGDNLEFFDNGNLHALLTSTGSLFEVGSAYTYGWSSTTVGNGTVDTGLSRASAGVVDLGNGTGGDKSGTLNLANINLGTQQTTQGALVLANTAAGAYATTVKSSNSATAAWTLTLPTTAGTNNYVLATNGSGVTSWVAGGSGCTITGSQYQIVAVNSAGTGCTPDANASVNAGALSLGASGTAGSVALGNATSGVVTLQPVAGALGTITASLPANAGTIAEINLAETWSALQKFTNADLALLGSSTGYTLLESGLSSTGNNTLTLPTTSSDTLAALGTVQTWTAAQTFGQISSVEGTITSSMPVQITQTWNSSGTAFTGFLVNVTNTASSASSRVFNFEVGGTSLMSLDTSGNFYTGANVDFGGANALIQFDSSANVLFFLDNGAKHALLTPSVFEVGSGYVIGWDATTGVTIVQDTGFSRDSAGVVDLGTGAQGSKAGSLNLASLTASVTINPAGYTVSTLPASPPKGAIAYVTDAVACTFLASLTGGSSTYCPVTYNGSAWVGG